MPASSEEVCFGSDCGFCVSSPGARSLASIELIMSLNSLNFSAGILRPFFVGPVYVSDFVYSRMSTPVLPLYSRRAIIISEIVPWYSDFGIMPISFSMG